MKIIFLNCWGGQLLEPLKEFIKAQKADTDVFCFQEANDMEEVLKAILSGYIKSTSNKDAYASDTDKLFNTSLATYARPGIEVIHSSPLLSDIFNTGLGLYTHLAVGTKSVHLVNMHGYPWPGKLDTPMRIEQSETFINSLKNKEGIRIVGGDLNVLPETKSAQMFSERGYQDLIRTYNIETTRNHFAWDLHPNKLYYSDYVFVDDNTAVVDFSVPDLEISDHLPMILKIQL